MIAKLIGTIIALVFIAFFAGFNLDNKCPVNLLVHEFKNVPVFFTIIISFVAGIVFSLPFVFFHRSSKSKSNGTVDSVASAKGKRPSFWKRTALGKKTIPQNAHSLAEQGAEKTERPVSSSQDGEEGAK